MKTLSSYTEGNTRITYPDQRVWPEPGDEFIPTRGYGYTMVVKRGSHFAGYVKVEDLGFDSVKAWMAAQH